MTSVEEQVFKTYIERKSENLSDASKRIYYNRFLKLMELSEGEPFWKLTQGEILSKIKNSRDYTNLLRMLIAIKDQEGKPIKSLVREFNKQKGRQLKLNVVKTKEIIDNSPSLEQLKEAHNNMTGQLYLMLYIIMNFGVRNKDLVMKLNDDDKKGNSIIKKKNSILYIRRDYKTAGKYGTQKHTIKDKRFIKEFDDYTNGRYEGYLFLNRDGNILSNTHIAQYISRQLNKIFPNTNLTQSKIFKIINHQFKSNDAVVKHKKLMSTRGHSYNVNETNY